MSNNEAQAVSVYLTQDLNDSEKQSYVNYINGDQNSTDWIEKTNKRRDKLLVHNLQCSDCREWIGITETGVCTCLNNHPCHNVVIQQIHDLNNILL